MTSKFPAQSLPTSDFVVDIQESNGQTSLYVANIDIQVDVVDLEAEQEESERYELGRRV